MNETDTVLVVDDSPTQQLQIRMVLEADGFDVQLAGDGQEALEMIERKQPDIVVTDLQMPRINGLELLLQIKRRFPSIPVIVATALGSETIAAEALQKGASSYVHKRELAETLAAITRQVLAISRATKDQAPCDTTSCIVRTELHLQLENDESLIPGVIARIESALGELQFCDEMEWMQIAMALDESILNAMVHGNLEVSSELRHLDDGQAFTDMIAQRKTESPHRERRVRVTVRVTPCEAIFVIRDEGPGFDIHQLPDPTDPENLEKAGGRGLLLIHSFMDEVHLNQVGNEITMLKRKPLSIGGEEDADDEDAEDEPSDPNPQDILVDPAAAKDR